MKSGASSISKHILSLSVIRTDDGREARAVTKQGTAFFLRPDHLRPNRIGSGTMLHCKRVSERLQRASAHYATRTAFLSQEKHVRGRRPCVFLDRGPESVGAYAVPEIWEGEHRKMRLQHLREGRSFPYPNPDNPLSGVRRRCRPVIKPVPAALLFQMIVRP